MSSNSNKTAHTEHQNPIKKIPVYASSPQREVPSDRIGYLTTEEMANAMGLQAQSIRKRLSETSSYFGLKPVKLPNRRLIWNADAVSKFLRGEGF